MPASNVRVIRRCCRVTLWAIAGWSAIGSVALAHPFHTSIGEAELNPETKRLEVSLRVDADELEHALDSSGHDPVTLDDSAAADEAIQKYLQECFVVRRDKQTAPLRLEWVGKEVNTKHAWLYFELDAPDGIEGYELTNRVLLDAEETQINTVVFKLQGRKVSLRTDRKRPTTQIQLDDATGEPPQEE